MTSFDEQSIYNLLTVEEKKQQKPNRYTSKYQQSVKDEYASGRWGSRTMGPEKVLPPLPSEYLKKHVKDSRLSERVCFHYPDEDRNKPPVPKKDDAPVMGLKSVTNFRCVNANRNITSVPKEPTKRFVDTRHGDAHKLIPSGLEPVYVHKKDYGEVPTYITRRKEEVNVTQDRYDQYVTECFKQGALKQLSAEEHAAILNGLKANWEDVHDRYQSMSLVTDCLSKKQRKQRIEGQMKQLERDIELFEKYKIVYIGN